MTNQDSWVWSTAHQSSAKFPDDAEATLIPGMGREGMNWNHMKIFRHQGRQKKSRGSAKKSLKISTTFRKQPFFKEQQRKDFQSRQRHRPWHASPASQQTGRPKKSAFAAKKTPRFLAENHGIFFSEKTNGYSYWKIIKAHGSHDTFRFTKFFAGNCLCCSNFGAFFFCLLPASHSTIRSVLFETNLRFLS